MIVKALRYTAIERYLAREKHPVRRPRRPPVL